MEFKEGDVVKLKSGGPLMTIQSTDMDDPNEILCCWFVNDKPVVDSFYAEMLEAQPPNEVDSK